MVRKMTPIERGKALALLSVGLSIAEVARRMGRAKSSIFKLKGKKERSDSVRACQTTPGAVQNASQIYANPTPGCY